MKVKGIESAHFSFRFSFYTIILAFGLALTAAAPPVSADSGIRKEKDSNEKHYREAKKAIREGKYDKAIVVYTDLLNKDGRAIQAHLGIALAYAKQLNFQSCYDHAIKVIEIEPNNARAHALAGLALLRSGFVPSAVERLVQSVTINPKEALAFGAAAEIDYYEGRAREAHIKALHAYNLDPAEPDFLV